MTVREERTMSFPPGVLDRVERLRRDLSADELRDLLGALLEQVQGYGTLDAAAALAARFEGLEGEEASLRSWLAYMAARNRLVHELGGGPRHVLDESTRLAMLQTQLAGEAIATIWQEDMLEPKDTAVALGARPTNREKVRQYRERSWLLGLPWGRGYLYPAFQFDPEKRDVYPAVREVNEALRAADDPWGVASWWISRHARLAARPMDLVGTDRAKEIVEVAAAVTEPVG